jgi:RND family efflux transporter MFP subunit
MNIYSHRFESRILLIIALAVFLLPAVPVLSQDWAGSGITEPYRDATVSTTVVGAVSSIDVAEGQFVRRGQTLIELDNELEKLEVERRKLVMESKVELESAQAQLELLEKDLATTRELYQNTRSISEEDLMKKEMDYKLAEAEVNRLKITEQREEIEYEIAQAQLANRLVTAPFDGIVVRLFVEEGENCSPQQPLVRIADTRRVRLVVHMDSGLSRTLERGMAVRVRVDEMDNPVTRRGNVEFISPVVDPSSGLREVKVLFDNSDSRVHPGIAGSLLLE